MDPLQIVLVTVLLPAATALAVMAVTGWVGAARAGGVKPGLRALAAPRWSGVALAAAFGLGFALILSWPALPPVDVTQVGPWAAVFAAPLAFLPGRLRALAVAVLGAALGYLLARPAYQGLELAAWVAAVTATATIVERGLLWVTLGADPAPGPTSADAAPRHEAAEMRCGGLIALLYVGGVSLVTLFADVASLAMVTGALVSGVGALWAVGFVAPQLAIVGRAAPVIALVTTAHLYAGLFYASGGAAALVMLVFAPLLGGLARRLATSDRWRRLAPLLLSGGLLAGAAAVAASGYFSADESASAASDEDDGYYDGGDGGYDSDYGY